MDQHEVIIYTTKVCPYCRAAKDLFTGLAVPYREVELDSNPDLRAKLSVENGGWRTVPMIFVNGKFIGGFDDTQKLIKSGTLQKMLGLS